MLGGYFFQLIDLFKIGNWIEYLFLIGIAEIS